MWFNDIEIRTRHRALADEGLRDAARWRAKARVIAVGDRAPDVPRLARARAWLRPWRG